MASKTKSLGTRAKLPARPRTGASVSGDLSNRPMFFGAAGYEGGSNQEREFGTWHTPGAGPVDVIVNRAKSLADARSQDSARNMGIIQGGVGTHKDSIVGAQYKLTSQINTTVLNSLVNSKSDKFSDAWAEETQEIIEGRFNLIADSDDHWFDAEGIKSFTDIVRLSIGCFAKTGETLATAEWDRSPNRPFSTCVQMVSPDRLCNPDNGVDQQDLRRGVQINPANGRPVSYNFRQDVTYSGQLLPSNTWVNVAATKPWGRHQVIHIFEQDEPGQHRGISGLVSALKDTRMFKKFKETTLQQAVLAATYAATIESELPSESLATAMGGGANGLQNAYGQFMSMMAQFSAGGSNLKIDGARIPHLPPNTRLNVKPVGTQGGVGTEFEASLLRHIATSMGISYEELSRDYSRTNYSSLRGTLTQTGKFMAARKKHVADRMAGEIFRLWFEEEMNAGNIPLPPGVRRSIFYLPYAKEAFTDCEWTGSGWGQIDELRETQAALMRIGGGVSTQRDEASRLGKDWRKINKQAAREKTDQEKYGLVYSYDASKTNQNGADIVKDTNGQAAQSGSDTIDQKPGGNQ